MAGRRIEDNGSYVTPRRNYRVGITETDSGGVETASIPVLDTRRVPTTPNDSSPNIYGNNANIFFSVLLGSGLTSATVQTWMRADVEAVAGDVESSSSSLSPTEDWVLVQSDDLTYSELIKVLDVPPGRYRMVVSAMDGSGTINILSQFAG